GGGAARQSIATSPSSSRARHLRRAQGDRSSALAYSPVLIPLQFSASTCIAQNAWTARERMSVRAPKRRRGCASPCAADPSLSGAIRAVLRHVCGLLRRRSEEHTSALP